MVEVRVLVVDVTELAMRTVERDVGGSEHG